MECPVHETSKIGQGRREHPIAPKMYCECFHHMTLKEIFQQNLNPPPVLLPYAFSGIQQTEKQVCVRDAEEAQKGKPSSDCFFLLCRLGKMRVSLLVQTHDLLGVYRRFGGIWEKVVFADPEL